MCSASSRSASSVFAPPRPRVGACLVSLALPDQRCSRPSAAHGHHNECAAHGGHPGGPGRDALRCRGWAGFDSLCLHDDGVLHDVDCIVQYSQRRVVRRPQRRVLRRPVLQRRVLRRRQVACIHNNVCHRRRLLRQRYVDCIQNDECYNHYYNHNHDHNDNHHKNNRPPQLY